MANLRRDVLDIGSDFNQSPLDPDAGLQNSHIFFWKDTVPIHS